LPNSKSSGRLNSRELPSSVAWIPNRKGWRQRLIRLDDAGVDGETFTLDQTGRHAAPQHLIEQPAEQIAVTKTSMAILREGRVIGYFILQAQSAEPAIGQVQVHLFAQSPLGTDAIAVADDQHAHH